MSFRRDHGLKLAKSGSCAVKGRIVTVPSRSRKGQVYLVNMKLDRDPRCGCQDAVVNRQICAHIWAARTLLDGIPHGSGARSKRKEPQKKYQRAWADYNRAEVEAPSCALAIMEYLAEHLMGIADEGQAA